MPRKGNLEEGGSDIKEWSDIRLGSQRFCKVYQALRCTQQSSHELNGHVDELKGCENKNFGAL